MQLQHPPTDFSPVFFCPSCTAAWSTKEEAAACKDKFSELVVFKPGDIVQEVCPGYGWHDGLDHWVTEEKILDQDSKSVKVHNFYWVVTAVHSAVEVGNHNVGRNFTTSPYWAHRPYISVHTLGLKNGMPGGRACHGCPKDFKIVENPPKRVYDESRKLIGPIHKYMK